MVLYLCASILQLLLKLFSLIVKLIEMIINAIIRTSSKRKLNKIIVNKKTLDEYKIQLQEKRKQENSTKNDSYYNLQNKFLYKEFYNLYKEMENSFMQDAKFYNCNCCPYCGVVFDKKINTSKSCPDCGNKFFKRSNYLTKQGYLLSAERLMTFEKLRDKISNLRFYEEKFRYISLSEPDIKLIIDKFRTKPTITNEKDLFWNICSSLSSECILEGTKLLKKISKSNIDINTVHKANYYFLKDVSYQHLKIEMLEHEKKYKLLHSVFPQYIYCNIISEFINVKYDKFGICSMDWLYRTININILKEYLEKYSISINDFKSNFMNFAHGYPIEIISKSEAWSIIEKAVND